MDNGITFIIWFAMDADLLFIASCETKFTAREYVDWRPLVACFLDELSVELNFQAW